MTDSPYYLEMSKLVELILGSVAAFKCPYQEFSQIVKTQRV